MEVILLENIKNLGHFGEAVKVARGYARNFLVPQGKAVPSSEKNRAAFEERKAELQKLASDRLSTAQARANQIAATQLVFNVKASDEGKLYGSIGTAEIAKAFQDKQIEVRRQEVRLPMGPIRELGEFEVDIQPHAEIVCTIKVLVSPDK
jgi:large subunit ribosomal protein L9